MKLGFTPQDIRHNNQLNVIKLLKKKPHTHKQLATKLDLSNTAIQNILSSLLLKELVVVEKQLINKTGRPSTVVSLNTEKFFTILVFFNNTQVQISAYSFSKTLLAEIKAFYTPFNMDSANQVITESIRKMLSYDNLKYRTLCNISFSLPGLVTNDNVVATTSLNHNKEPYDPYSFFSKQFSCDILINDLKVNYTQGEYSTNKELKQQNVIAFYSITFPTLSLIINKQIYRGANGFFGEIGFLSDTLSTFPNENIRQLSPNNIDHTVSLNNVIDEITKNLYPDRNETLTLNEVADLLNSQHPLVVEKINNHCNRLCAFILNLSILFDFDALVFSGEIAPLKDYYFDKLNEFLTKNAFAPIKLILGNDSNVSTLIGSLNNAIDSGYNKLLELK